MSANIPKSPDKHPSIRATFLTCLENFSTDLTNVTAETKNLRILVADFKSGPAGPTLPILLQRIDSLKQVHNRLKELLDIYFNWCDNLTEHGKLKDSIMVPKKYHVTEVKGQLREFLQRWHSLRSERKGMEAKLGAIDEEGVDIIEVVEQLQM